MLNAGVIGMGVGEKHALAYEKHQNTYLKTICDFDQGKLNNLKKKFSNVFMERFKEFGLVSAVFRPCNRPLSEVVYDISHLSKDGSGICNSHEAGAE